MRSIEFLPKAAKQYAKLDESVQKSIKHKMNEYASYTDPFAHAKRLVSFEYGEYRFRIGDYRVICDKDEHGKIIIVALIGHRREIYD